MGAYKKGEVSIELAGQKGFLSELLKILILVYSSIFIIFASFFCLLHENK